MTDKKAARNTGKSDASSDLKEFPEVFKEELTEIAVRRRVAFPRERKKVKEAKEPGGKATPRKSKEPQQLAGLAFSGGGLRSASFCMGISQAFHKTGLWRFFDYLSTVSGGGYLGAHISSKAIRNKKPISSNEDDFPLPAGESSRSADSGQSDGVKRFIYGGRYLMRGWQLANKYLIGMLLSNLTLISAIVAGCALIAFLWRCFDYPWFRENVRPIAYAADADYLKGDLIAAFYPFIFLSLAWVAAWTVSYFRRGSEAPGRVARILLYGVAASFLIGGALVLSNGDVPELGESFKPSEWGVKIWGPIAAVIGGSLIPFLRPSRLMQSGLHPSNQFEKVTFGIASTGLLIGLPLLLIGFLGRENISGYHDSERREIIPNEVLWNDVYSVVLSPSFLKTPLTEEEEARLSALTSKKSEAEAAQKTAKEKEAEAESAAEALRAAEAEVAEAEAALAKHAQEEADNLLKAAKAKVAETKIAEAAIAVKNAAEAKRELETAKVTESESTESESTEPESTESESTEPESTEPESTEPESTEPESTEPESTEPEPTEPEPTEPEPTEPESTEPKDEVALKAAEVKVKVAQKAVEAAEAAKNLTEAEVKAAEAAEATEAAEAAAAIATGLATGLATGERTELTGESTTEAVADAGENDTVPGQAADQPLADAATSTTQPKTTSQTLKDDLQAKAAEVKSVKQLLTEAKEKANEALATAEKKAEEAVKAEEEIPKELTADEKQELELLNLKKSNGQHPLTEKEQDELIALRRKAFQEETTDDENARLKTLKERDLKTRLKVISSPDRVVAFEVNGFPDESETQFFSRTLDGLAMPIAEALRPKGDEAGEEFDRLSGPLLEIFQKDRIKRHRLVELDEINKDEIGRILLYDPNGNPVKDIENSRQLAKRYLTWLCVHIKYQEGKYKAAERNLKGDLKWSRLIGRENIRQTANALEWLIGIEKFDISKEVNNQASALSYWGTQLALSKKLFCDSVNEFTNGSSGNLLLAGHLPGLLSIKPAPSATPAPGEEKIAGTPSAEKAAANATVVAAVANVQAAAAKVEAAAANVSKGSRTAERAPYSKADPANPLRTIVIYEDQVTRLKICFLALALFAAGLLVDLNFTSMHGYYRRRIASAFIVPEGKKRESPMLSALNTTDYGYPYHLISGSINLPSPPVGEQIRNATSAKLNQENSERPPVAPFLFSQRYCGSDFSRYSDTHHYEELPVGDLANLDLADAVAMSGGAVSPGQVQNPLLAFLMHVLNMRLGQWLPNPAKEKSPPARPRLSLLIRNAFRKGRDRDYFFITDGGHSENLGLVNLLERGCRLIVVIDAGCDPDHQFLDLAQAIRFARIEKGIKITPFTVEGEPETEDIVRSLRFEEPRDKDQPAPASTRHFSMARIEYPKSNSEGLLVYVKPSLTGDESADLIQYSRSEKQFPHESTSDQEFEWEQVESYRQLGYHIGNSLAKLVDDGDLWETKANDAPAVEEICERFLKSWMTEVELDAEPDSHRPGSNRDLVTDLIKETLTRELSKAKTPAEPEEASASGGSAGRSVEPETESKSPVAVDPGHRSIKPKAKVKSKGKAKEKTKTKAKAKVEKSSSSKTKAKG